MQPYIFNLSSYTMQGVVSIDDIGLVFYAIQVKPLKLDLGPDCAMVQ